MTLGRRSLARGPRSASADRLKTQRGSEFIEGMLMMLPFLALVFLVIDCAYGLFINATLQYAVQAGVTYASTDSDTAANVMTGVQNTVNTSSLNLVPAANVTVNFYTPSMVLMNNAAVPNQTGKETWWKLPSRISSSRSRLYSATGPRFSLQPLPPVL